MADQQEPMIKLEPGGKAPILSYNVPEPTSYSGRNFINIELEPEDFNTATTLALPEVGVDLGAASTIEAARRIEPGSLVLSESRGTGAVLESGDLPPALALTRGMLTLRANPAEPENAMLGERLSPALARLSAHDVGLLRRMSQQIMVYRSISGALTYRVSPRSVVSESHAMQASAPPQPGEAGEKSLPAGAQDAFSLKVWINSPTATQHFSGPSTGVTVMVRGKSSDLTSSSAVKKVEVKADASAYQMASPASPGVWDQWSRSLTLTTAGTHTLMARATNEAGKTRTDTVTIHVTLAPPAVAPTDTTAPTLTVMSPATGAFVVDPSGSFNVSLAGITSDSGSGVAQVEVALDGDLAHFIPANPLAQNDWSSWTLVIPCRTPGPHVLTVRARDQQNNSTMVSISVQTAREHQIETKGMRLLLVEGYRLSSFFGSYGAGRTLKTFSLLPGEKTRISVKSYMRRDEQRKEASTILDSLEDSTADEFQHATDEEQSYKANYEESFKWSVKGEASATWGWGSAKVSGEVGGGSNAAREEFAKNVSNATQKHTAKASAKRDVTVNTSFEVRTESGEETSIERTIENVNLSRTMNFVFRQMNQEYITLLHLVDVRIGFVRIVQVDGGHPFSVYREATLPQLDSMLREVILPGKVEFVMKAIIYQLENIFDYTGTRLAAVEQAPLSPSDQGASYLRFKKAFFSTYKDAATGTELAVPGIILAANKYVLRTEGVIVDAMLGQGDALDLYSAGLQDESVRTQRLRNDRAAAEVDKITLANKLVREGSTDKAALFAKVHPCCCDKHPKTMTLEGGTDTDG